MKRVTMRMIQKEAERVFGGGVESLVCWLMAEDGRTAIALMVCPRGIAMMRFEAWPNRDAAKQLALSTLQRMR